MTAGNSVRGSALPETAIVMSAALMMIFGIIQLGIIGFLQVMCDGAVFVAAHEYSLGNSAYQQYAQHPFPMVSAPLFADLNGPDSSPTSVPVAFPNTSSAREGGVSLLLPSHGQITAHATGPAGMLGIDSYSLSNIDLHGTAIEPEYQLNNDLYDIAKQGYTGGSSQVNFFTDQENTAYYYVSNHRLLTCVTKSMTTTAGTITPAITSFDSTNCPVANQVLRSLGTAEFIDQVNWFNNNLGVQFYGPGTFWEVLCHARMFSYAAKNVFVPAASAAAMPDVDITHTDGSSGNPSAAGVVGDIYTMDTTWPLNYAANTLTWAQTNQYPSPYALAPQSYCSYYEQ